MSPYAYTFTKKKPSTYKFNRIPDMDRLSINDLHVNQDEDVGEKLVKEKEIYYQVEKSWVNEQQKNSWDILAEDEIKENLKLSPLSSCVVDEQQLKTDEEIARVLQTMDLEASDEKLARQLQEKEEHKMKKNRYDSFKNQFQLDIDYRDEEKIYNQYENELQFDQDLVYRRSKIFLNNNQQINPQYFAAQVQDYQNNCHGFNLQNRYNQERVQHDPYDNMTYEQYLELDAGLYDKGNGANSQIISSLPVSKYNLNVHNDQNECPICQNNFENEEEILRLPCLHIFHPKCGHDWLERKNSCPICKTEVKL